MQTLWTFLVQVLHPDCSCRAAVAQVLAQQAILGESSEVSADPTAYCQGRRRLPLGLFKEICMHLVAYNLIRALMWQAAQEHDRPLHRLSFAGIVQRFSVAAPYLDLYCGTAKAVRLYRFLLKWITGDLLPYRPNRIEPQAIKRRPQEYALLNRSRQEMREALS